MPCAFIVFYSNLLFFINNVVFSGKKWVNIHYIYTLIKSLKQKMSDLIGTYECKIDAKGRFKLPTAFKKQLKDVLAQGFVMKRSVFSSCLELYAMPAWSPVLAKVNGLNRFVKKNNDFIRLFTAGVKLVELDATDRLLVSKDLLVYAGMKKEIVLSASGSLIEIWDKERYEQVIQESIEDFADLAEEVMGNIEGDRDE